MPVVHLDAGRFPQLGQARGGFVLVIRELRLTMKLPVNLDQLADVLAGPLGGRLRAGDAREADRGGEGHSKCKTARHGWTFRV